MLSLVTKGHTFSGFPKVLFLFQDPIQDTTLHLVVMSLQALPACDNFLDFPCF